MAFPFLIAFLVLLGAYMVYSEWTRLDSRYPLFAGFLLLIVAAILEALALTDAAATLALFVFFLLVAGVVLLLVDYLRATRGSPRPGSP